MLVRRPATLGWALTLVSLIAVLSSFYLGLPKQIVIVVVVAFFLCALRLIWSELTDWRDKGTMLFVGMGFLWLPTSVIFSFPAVQSQPTLIALLLACVGLGAASIVLSGFLQDR